MKKIISFRREKIRLFWKTTGMEILVVGACFATISSVIFFWRWLKMDEIPVLTNQDIAALARLSVKYSIPGWWELLFACLWGILLYVIIDSRHLKNKLPRLMKAVYFFLVAGLGLYCALTFRGFLYGLITSVIIAVIPPILLALHWLWCRAKLVFSTDYRYSD
jgi:hypothetical protein